MHKNYINDVVHREFIELKNTMENLFLEQWKNPELPCMEKVSSANLVSWLRQNDFQVTIGAHNIPTSFIAKSKPKVSGPNIGIIAEYDALPGLGNEATPKRKGTSKLAGHGCGHNHIGPANSGAAIIAAKVCKNLNIAGNISVIGCPAEEILWGKIALLNNGAFSDLDCILTSHGDYQNGSMVRPCQSVVAGELIFEGKSGHGGNVSEINALTAVESLIQSVQQKIKPNFPQILFRHVIRQGGMIPTITPEESRVWYATRGFDFNEVQAAYNAIIDISRNLSSELKIEFHHQFISETRGYLPNEILGKELFKALEQVGPPKWSTKDLIFMEKLVAELEPGKPMTLDKKIGYYDKDVDYFGQDDGEVSWRIPLGRLNWAYPLEVPIHHWAWTALSGNKASNAGPLMVSEALALTIVNLLSNPELIEKSQKELMQKTEGIIIGSPRLGAFKTLTQFPKLFWEGTWRE